MFFGDDFQGFCVKLSQGIAPLLAKSTAKLLSPVLEQAVADAVSGIEKGPEPLFLSLEQVLAIFPVGKSTWWDGVKKGDYPAPYRLSDRRVAWDMEELRQLKARLVAEKRCSA